MGSGPKYPKPSSEERQLYQTQTSLLNQQRDLMQEQLRRQDLLAPALYQQAGLRPIYEGQYGQEAVTADALSRRGYSFIQNPDGSISSATDSSGQTLDLSSGMLPATGGTGRVIGFEQFETPEQALAKREVELLQRQADIQEQMLPYQLEALGFQMGADGKITKAPETEDARKRREIEDAFLNRQLQALKGELPVAPGLLRDLEKQEQLTNERLRKQLGSGYETSSPGIETLGNFQRNKAEALENARRGDISAAVGLSAQSNAANQAARQNVFENASILGTPTVQSAQALSPVASAGRTGATLQQMIGTVQAPFQGVNGLGNLAQAYSGPLSYQTNERAGQFANKLQRYQNRANLYGSLIGGLLGAAGGYFGGAQGAAAGRAAGSSIGYGIA